MNNLIEKISKHKVIFFIFVLVILSPIIYFAYDRVIIPPPPNYNVPVYATGQSWEQYAHDFLVQQNQSNALKYYLDAYSMATDRWDSFAQWEINEIINQGWNKDYPIAEKILQRHQAAVELIIKGAQMKQCEFPPFPIDTTTFYHSMIIHPNAINMGRLVALQARKYEKDKLYQSAFHTYLDGIQYVMDFQEIYMGLITPSLINPHILGISNLVLTNRLTQSDYFHLLSELTRFENEMNTMSEIIDENYQIFYFQFYHNSENPFQTARQITQTLHPPNTFQDQIKLYKSAGHMFMNRGKYLRNYQFFIEEFVKESKNKSYFEFAHINWNSKAPDYPAFLKLSVRTFLDTYTRQMISITQFRLIQLQSAIQLYHLRNKQYPSGLDDLTEYLDPIPLDPFTDQPFLWSMDTSGRPFVYSTGPDFQDNQAAIPYDPTNGTTSTGDIWF